MAEDQATKINTESEMTVYCQITDFEGLTKAVKYILQEQYEIKPIVKNNKPEKKGKIRVRKEVCNGIESYTQTIKTDITSDIKIAKNIETTISIDREYFDAFKAISSSGMIKTRYMFPLDKLEITEIQTGKVNTVESPDSYFEVDVFSSAEGKQYRWCKVDIELDEIFKLAVVKAKATSVISIKAVLSNLPFKPIDMFLATDATFAQKFILDCLYKDVFTSS